jgi:hypothetical protein
MANPGVPHSTAAVFAARQGGFSAPARWREPISEFRSWVARLAACRNDLEAPALGLVPEIREVLATLRDTAGCMLARMSGSGATCCGLYALEAAAKSPAPVALCGTAFAFVHLLDELERRGVRAALPEGSRVMETGGFKGRSRALGRADLHASISTALGVPTAAIVNQYGMCELGSQFYEASLRTGRPTQTKRVPPWVRTRVLDPATGKEVPTGETGVLVHYDLANTGSVLAVQTSDLGLRRDDGFEVLGRLQGAEERGCSIAADALFTDR